MANNSSGDDTILVQTVYPIPQAVRFWSLLIFDIPAALCTLFLLFHLCFKRTLRQALNNHVVIVLLILALSLQLIDIPFYIAFLCLGHAWSQTSIFCSIWMFIDIGLFDMIVITMAYASVERHILVFHSGWLSTRKKRFFIHYLPLTIIISYGLFFYAFVIFFPPCENIFDYYQEWCSYPCYYDDLILGTYDLVGNGIFPTLLIAASSLALLLRFINQNRRTQRRIQWHKYRKMTIQLLSISLLQIVLNLPELILLTAHLCGLAEEIGAEAEIYTYFFAYFIVLLLPYVCLISLPEVWKKLKIHPIQWFRARLQRTNIVTPFTVQSRT